MGKHCPKGWDGAQGVRIAVSMAAKGGEGLRLPTHSGGQERKLCNNMLEQELKVKLSVEGCLDTICMAAGGSLLLAPSAACRYTFEASF